MPRVKSSPNKIPAHTQGGAIDPFANAELPIEWRPTLLREVLNQRFRKRKLEPEETYTRLGVRWYAEGPFKKDRALGREIGANYLNDVRPGDFIYNRLFAWKGSFGIVPEQMEGCVASNEFPTFEVTKDLADPKFLWRWFSQPIVWRKVEDQSTGSARTSRLRFKEEDLLRICVRLPSVAIQRAIGDALRTVQQAKEATEKVIAATRQLKASLMKHLFTYGPVPFNQADKVKLKETEIGLMPEPWKIVQLKEVIQKTNQTDPTRKPRERFKYVDVSSVSSENLKITGYTEYEGKAAPSRAKKEIKTGDVLLATVRPYLRRVAVVPPELDGQICSTAYCVLRAKTEVLDSGYLFFATIFEPFVNRVSEHQRGSSYPAVSDNNVRDELIPLSPLDEQREIVAQLAAVDAKLAAEEKRRAALDALFKSLLHHLMTGKVRLPEFAEAG